VLDRHGKAKAVKFDKITQQNTFCFAGVQIKFSMKEQDGRDNLSKGDVLGDWIIKTPSTKHKFVPLNEYTAMPPSDPVDTIKFCMDQMSLSAKDLEMYIGPKSRFSDVLNRKRKLSIRQIIK